MKSVRILIGLFFVLAASIAAKSQNDDNQNALLWKISGNGIEKPSYLFGTIHLMPAADYYFPSYMQDVFASCQALALEVDVVNMPLSEQIAMAKRAMMPAGKKLQDYMPEPDFQTYKNFIINDLGIKEKKFERMTIVQPLFSSGILLNELIKKPKGYETELGKLAKKRKMNILGLETMDYQFSIFEGISIEDQVKAMNMTDVSKNPMEEYNALKQLYLDQNLSELARMSAAETSIPDFEERFLNQRNRNWIPVIAEQIKKESTFIAVGAAHLPGEKGVLALLRAQGYTVEAVRK